MYIYLLPGFLYFILVPSFIDGVEFPRLLALIFSVSIIVLIRPNLFKINNKFLFLPISIPALMFISVIINEQDILNGLFGKQGRNFGILLYLYVALIIIGVSNLKSIDSKKLFQLSLMPIVIFSNIYGVFQVIGIDFLKWGEIDRIVLTLGNSNFAAGYLALLLPATLYGFFSYQKLYVKGIFFSLFALMIFLGMKTISSQFYLLSLISVLSFLIIFKSNNISKIPKNISIAGVLSLFSFLSIALYVNRKTIDDFTNAADRLSAQRAGLKIFFDHPFFGVGPDNLNRFMPEYILLSDLRREGFYNNPDRTHNTFVDLLANGGIFVGLSFLVFTLYIFFLILRLVKTNRVEKLELALPGAIFITYMAQSFVNTDSVLNLILPSLAMGHLISLHSEGIKTKSKISMFTKSIMLQTTAGLAVMGLLLVVPKAIVSERLTKEVVLGLDVSVEKVTKATNAWPDRGNIERTLVAIAQNKSNCPITLQVAERLLEVDSRSGQAWYVKAICVDATGDVATAKKFVKQALKFEPLNPTYLSALILLQEALNQKTKADETRRLLASLNFAAFS